MRRKTKIFMAIISIILVISSIFAAFFIISQNAEKTENIFPEELSVYFKESGKIEKIKREEFLSGCVFGFVFANLQKHEPQTLEALAAVINTNIIYELENKNKFSALGADIATSERFPYANFTENTDKTLRAAVKAAAKKSENRVLTDGKKPVFLEYCYISSGKTEKAAFMPSLELPSDALCGGYLSENYYNEGEIRRALSEIQNLVAPPEEWFSDAKYSEGGTLLSIKLCHQTLSGEEIQKKLGLHSAAISVSYANENFLVTCKGWGNNKGMSLSAADALSREGKTAEEILEFFYEAEIVEIN